MRVLLKASFRVGRVIRICLKVLSLAVTLVTLTRACTPYSPFPRPHTFVSKLVLPDKSQRALRTFAQVVFPGIKVSQDRKWPCWPTGHCWDKDTFLVLRRKSRPPAVAAMREASGRGELV